MHKLRWALLAALLGFAGYCTAKDHRFAYRVFYIAPDTAGISCYSGAHPVIESKESSMILVSCK